MGQEIDRMETNEILSSDDLAKLLNVSRNKLTRLVKAGLPSVSLGAGRKVFLKGSVLQWLQSLQK